MTHEIPTAAEVREALAALTLKQIDHLARLSGVSAATLAKIKYGQTKDPGLDKVGAFWPFVGAVRAPVDQQQGA